MRFDAGISCSLSHLIHSISRTVHNLIHCVLLALDHCYL